MPIEITLIRTWLLKHELYHESNFDFSISYIVRYTNTQYNYKKTRYYKYTYIKGIFIINLEYIQLITNLMITFFLRNLMITYVMIFNKAN